MKTTKFWVGCKKPILRTFASPTPVLSMDPFDGMQRLELRPGAQIRVKSPTSAFHGARGTVSHRVNASHLWAVRLEGFLGTVDFTANEMTVLN